MSTKDNASATTEEEEFERWHSQQTHDHGTLVTADKACVRAINKALEALLESPSATVSAVEIQSWIKTNLKFTIPLERIQEHCRYEAGEVDTRTKGFAQPKQNPTLQVLYALTRGKTSYTYQTRSHHNK